MMFFLEIPALLMGVAVCFTQLSRCEKSPHGRAEERMPLNAHNAPSNNTLKRTEQQVKKFPNIYRTQIDRKGQSSHNDERPTFASPDVRDSTTENDEHGSIVMATSKTDVDNPMPINRNLSSGNYNSAKILRSFTASIGVVFSARHSTVNNSVMKAKIQPSEVTSLNSESMIHVQYPLLSKPVHVHDRKALFPSSEYTNSNFHSTVSATSDFQGPSFQNSQTLHFLSRGRVIEPSSTSSLSQRTLKRRVFPSVAPSTTLKIAQNDTGSKHMTGKASVLHDIFQSSSQAQYSSTNISEHIMSPPTDVLGTYTIEHSKLLNSTASTSIHPSVKKDFSLTWEEHSVLYPKRQPIPSGSRIHGRVFPKHSGTSVVPTPTTSHVIPNLTSLPIISSTRITIETPIKGTSTSKVAPFSSTRVNFHVTTSFSAILLDSLFSSPTAASSSAANEGKASATQEVSQSSSSQHLSTSRGRRMTVTSTASASTTVTSSYRDTLQRNEASLPTDISIAHSCTDTSHVTSIAKIDFATASLSNLSSSRTPDVTTIYHTLTTAGLLKGGTTTTGPNKQIPKTPPKNLPVEFEKTTPYSSQQMKTTRVPIILPDGFPPVYLVIMLKIPMSSFCDRRKEFQLIIAKLAERSVPDSVHVQPEQVKIANTGDCDSRDRSSRVFIRIQEQNTVLQPVHVRWQKMRGRSRRESSTTDVFLYVVNTEGNFDLELTRSVFREMNSSLNPLQDSTFSDKVLSVSLVDNRPATTSHEFVAKATRTTPLNPGVIAAVVLVPVAVLCLLAFGIVRVILSRRRGKAMRSYFTGSREPSFDSRSTNDFPLETFPGFRRSKRNRKSKRSTGFVNTALQTEEGLPSNPVNRTALARLCYDVDLLGEEFKLIPNLPSRLADLPQGCEEKNRFANVIPNSRTCVMLPVLLDCPQSQYINANYVRGYMGERCYIATQAPLDNTIYDFWRMVWENHSQVIVMLTELNECGLPKCSPYWPSSEGADTVQQYENLEISLKKREVKKDYIMSKLRLKDTETKQWRDLVHFWFLSWPHHGVPESPLALLTFLDEVKPYMAISNGPTIVHCSPGTGRTGAFLAIHICMVQYDESEAVDVLSCVHRLRQDRAGLLQTKDQYTFIYTTLNEYATCLHCSSHDDTSGSDSDDDVS